MWRWDGDDSVWKVVCQIKAIEENDNIYYNHIAEKKAEQIKQKTELMNKIIKLNKGD